MGLDVSFNREQALAAGMRTRIEPNGSMREIYLAQNRDYVDQDYLDWLCQNTELIQFPNMQHWVDNGLVTDKPPRELVIVRANKWGETYEPLTRWLKAHKITWQEG